MAVRRKDGGVGVRPGDAPVQPAGPETADVEPPAPVQRYDAFISYSHAVDGKLAPAIQTGLHRFAKPWYRVRALRVFRDMTSLSATPELWPSIVAALDGSRWLVLLASPEAARSTWVNDEVDHWCSTKSMQQLIVVVTHDDREGDFDWEKTDAFPPALRRRLEDEPRVVDLRWAQAGADVSLHNARFRDAIADLAAPIHGVPKDELSGEDVRQHRRTRRVAWGAVATLVTFLAVAVLAAVIAVNQRDRAQEQARLALSRQLAAQAVTVLSVDPAQSLVLAAQSAATAGTDQATDALRQALRGSRQRWVIDAEAPVHDAQVDPQGRLLAAALANGTVRVWKASTRRPVATLRLGRAPLSSVGFSRDGKRLLAAGDAGAAVWPLPSRTARPFAVFDRKGTPLAAALSPDGGLAATGDEDGVVRLWRATTGVLDRRLRPGGERAPVTAVAFSTDGSRLIAASGSRTTVWDLAARSQPVHQQHDQDVWAVAFGRNANEVATGDAEGVARVWNIRTGNAVELNGHDETITGLAFSPDGRLLATASEDETARIWDAVTGRSLAELRGHGGLVFSAAFAPDGRTVVTGGEDGTIRGWAAASDPVLASFSETDREPVHAVAFDPSGSRVVTASEDGKARIYTVGRRRPLRAVQHGHAAGEWVESAQFSHDGRYLLTAGDDGTAKIWAAASGALLVTLGHRGGPELWDASLSPDGRFVAAGGRGRAVRLWRWRTRTAVLRLGDFPAGVGGVAFSPDGALIAAAGGNAVRVWHVPDGALVASLSARDQLTSVAFDPGEMLVAAGGTSGKTWIWDLATGALRGRVPSSGDRVTDVGFSADGRYLVTAARNGIASVWTVPGGDLVTTIRTRASDLEGAVFAPRGRKVAVAGSGGLVTVFDCAECRPLRALACLAASRVTPEVRARERKAFAACS